MNVDAAFIATFAALQACLCSVAALTLFSIWMGGFETEQHEHRKDTGIGFLCLACGTWAFVGLVVLLFGLEPIGFLIYRPLLSVLNSLFLIGAVAHFDVINTEDRAGRFLAKILRPAHKVWIAIAVGMVSYIVLTAIPPLHNVLDVTLSVVTLGLLFYALSLSFWQRGFHLLAVVAVAILLVQLMAQLPELSGVSRLSGVFQTAWLQFLVEARWPLLVVSKSMLCMLFIALAFSWMHEKALKLSSSKIGNEPKRRRGDKAPQLASPTEGSGGAEHELCLKILPPQYRPDENRTVFEIEVRAPALDQRITLKEKAYLRILELVNFRLKTKDGWVAYEELHGVGRNGDTATIRQDFEEIWKAVRTRVPLLIQVDEEQRKRRIWAEARNISIDSAQIQSSMYNWSNKDFWRHLNPRPSDDAGQAGTTPPVN